MQRSLLLLCSLLLAIPLVAQTQRSIDLSDMDRKADPCDNFYDYANGTWRAQNPIPASMDRWSRRWAAGEANKEQLKTILEEAAAKHNQPMGSSVQLTGDFYAACTDMSAINAAGVTPLKPLLGQIDAIHDGAGVQKTIVELAWTAGGGALCSRVLSRPAPALDGDCRCGRRRHWACRTAITT